MKTPQLPFLVLCDVTWDIRIYEGHTKVVILPRLSSSLIYTVFILSPIEIEMESRTEMNC